MLRQCMSAQRCKKCSRKHHTLLHEDNRTSTSGTPPPAQPPPVSSSSNLVRMGNKRVVMKVIVEVIDHTGWMQKCRLFIDPGSEGDFITEDCVRRLKLKRSPSNVQVIGAGESDAGMTRGVVTTTLHSRFNPDKAIQTDLLILKKLTGKLPSVPCRQQHWKHLEDLTLSDPEWHQPAKVDILLGIAYFEKIMLEQRRRGNDGEPFAWNTIFGWAVGGECPVAEATTVKINHISMDPIRKQLQQFWEVEEPPRKRILTTEEKNCEEHFKANVKRDSSGQFVVAVPFNEKKNTLGRSRDIAIRRLNQVERRLSKNPKLAEQYRAFMKEYEDLGHMTRTPQQPAPELTGKTNYLCHHFVTNESSITTKLRVVFDGSAVTTSGVSLNQTMLVGATMQDDLYDILLRFRVFSVVVKADIAKMFRQFKLCEEDRELYRIVWRASPADPITDYTLNTVTYGTASAPFLSTRCLNQLATDLKGQYPLAAEALELSTYVDDILHGGESEEEVLALVKELNEGVATAGLELRKWTSNSPKVMEIIPEELRDVNPLSISGDELVKALGVQWHPQEDVFRFQPMSLEEQPTLTKRVLLSEIAKLFDPLGLVSCVTLRGKLLLQELWKCALDWDEAVPSEIEEKWRQIRNDLSLLPSLVVPRRITVSNCVRYELHGFSDSSEVAYGGVIYLRSLLADGGVEVRMITSKTHVAPLRQVTLPRLELCAAVLTAELIVHVKEILKIDAELFMWSDSTITLKWIESSPRRWKTYIANRVATIQELTPTSAWRHVAGVENPADLASRGTSVENLIDNSLWWRGPHWLSEKILQTFPTPTTVEGDLEEKTTTVITNAIVTSESEMLLRYSSLEKLKRMTCYVFRYLLFRVKKKRTGPLLPSELESSKWFWTRKIQSQYFAAEMKAIRKDGHVCSGSKLKSLFPFIDSNGILRVSGRVSHAPLTEERKHQAIIPAYSHFTELLIADCHSRTFHGGFQVVWATLQREYWILDGRDKARRYIRRCVRCIRYRAKAAEQLMGDLPSARVTPSRAFTHTGVDFAGPFVFKNPVGRAPKTYKGYLSLFVCLSTKAIHLEAVSSLSTDGFLAALRRFTSIRGLCSFIYSDNGTNFVGADRELLAIMAKLNQDEIAQDLAKSNTKWEFNTPSAPHRGGLWEAGVKSTKHHLRRVLGSNPLRFEQFTTVITQISAVLNSRPLYQRSSDPADFEPLTPGHFLIGAPLLALPDLDVTSAKVGSV